MSIARATTVKLSRDPDVQGPVVTGFAADGFRIEEEVIRGGLWLTPEWARSWDAPDLERLDAAAIDELLSLQPKPEFLILGTGASLRRPSPAFVNAVETQGMGVEVMDSRAAARAWGVLRAEDRWIVAALLPFN